MTENLASILKRLGFTNAKMSIGRVSIDDLKEDVQRVEGVDFRKVNRIADSLNPYGLGVIVVSQRANGDKFVIDGRHRCHAARAADYTSPIPAVIISGLSRDQEHELFIILNTRTAVSALSHFVNSVGALRPDHVVMNQVIEDNGWKVGLAADDGVLAAVAAVERIYKSGSKELLDRTLKIITTAWEWDRKSADAAMLLGVSQLLSRFGDNVEDDKLVAVLSDTRPGVLIGKAKALRDYQGGTVAAAMAKVLVGLYNKRRRTNLLPEWVWIR